MRLWTLATPPWRRAPLLALGQPGVLAAVIGAAAILGVAAGSGPLFLSSAGSAAMQRYGTEFCPEQSLPTVASPERSVLEDYADAGARQADDRAVRAAFADYDLPAPYRVLTAESRARLGDNPNRTTVTLYARADVLEHVDVLERRPGPGVFMSDLEMERRGLSLGDRVTVGRVSAPIVGKYRDLNGPGFGDGVPRYWCSWSHLIIASLEVRPPPLLLTDEDTLGRLAALSAQVAWYSRVELDQLSLRSAHGVVDRFEEMDTDGISVPGLPLPEMEIGLAGDLERAENAVDGLRGPVLPVTAAGTLVALALLAGAGTYWAERRRAEIRLLAARGASQGALAVKAVLEMLVPVVVGVAFGAAIAGQLVRWLGPSEDIEAGVVGESLGASAIAAVLGLLLLGAVAAARSGLGNRVQRPLGRRWWVLLPWEVVLLGASVLVYQEVDARGGGITVLERAVTIDPLLIVFPLLALAGALLLAARLVGFATPMIRRAGAWLAAGGYLASRRLTGGLHITLTILVLAALPLGVLVYAGALTRSASDSVEAKAEAYLGTEVALVTHVEPGTAIDTGGHGTQVSVIMNNETAAGETLVLGVHPETFAEYATLDEEVIGAPLPDLMDRLGAAEQGEATPAVLANCDDCPPIDHVNLRSTELPVDPVATVDLVPGMRMADEPVLVVPWAALTDIDPYADRIEEIWTTPEQLSELNQVLADAEIVVDRQRQPEGFVDVTDLLPVTWGFGYLQALAGLTGVIAVCGVLLYVAARSRHRVVSYVVARRMGLRRGAHLRSLVYELTALLGLAWVLGLATGWGAVVLIHRLLNLNPAYPPDALLRPHTELLVAATVTVLVVVAAGTALAQRAADRVRPAEIMRME